MLTTPDGDAFKTRRIPGASCDYRRFLRNSFRDALLGKAKLAVSPEWARSVMRVLELAQESSERGCTVPYNTGCSWTSLWRKQVDVKEEGRSFATVTT